MANLDKQILYEYIAVWNPTTEQAKEGQKSKIILPLTHMLAREEKAVFMNVVKILPAEYNDSLDQVDIIIRSF